MSVWRTQTYLTSYKMSYNFYKKERQLKSEGQLASGCF